MVLLLLYTTKCNKGGLLKCFPSSCLMRKHICMKYKQSRKHRISNTLVKCVKSNKLQHRNKLRAKLLISTKKLQVFVFIWTSTKLRGGDWHTHCYTRGREREKERGSLCECERDRKRALPGDLKVPMFPHFWELVIYSCWSHIKQDQRLLPDIFWTYWGNSNDYQRILPTNDDTGTILRESEYKTNTEPRQAAHKGTQLNGFHDYS